MQKVCDFRTGWKEPVRLAAIKEFDIPDVDAGSDEDEDGDPKEGDKEVIEHVRNLLDKFNYTFAVSHQLEQR